MRVNQLGSRTRNRDRPPPLLYSPQPGTKMPNKRGAVGQGTWPNIKKAVACSVVFINIATAYHSVCEAFHYP